MLWSTYKISLEGNCEVWHFTFLFELVVKLFHTKSRQKNQRKSESKMSPMRRKKPECKDKSSDGSTGNDRWCLRPEMILMLAGTFQVWEQSFDGGPEKKEHFPKFLISFESLFYHPYGKFQQHSIRVIIFFLILHTCFEELFVFSSFQRFPISGNNWA